MRCDHCGVTQEHAETNRSDMCAPPFVRQLHSFTGKHPADVRESLIGPHTTLTTSHCEICNLSAGRHLAGCANDGRSDTLPPGIYNATFDGVKMTPKGPVVTGVRVIDTGELGPVKVATPTHRQLQAKIVRDALEAAANAEPDQEIGGLLLMVARGANTETLAYIARLLKG